MVFVVYTEAMGIVIGVMVGDKEVVEDDDDEIDDDDGNDGDDDEIDDDDGNDGDDDEIDDDDDDRTSSVDTFVEAQSPSHSLSSPPL